MFKHTISELKEALVCLQAGKVTLAYPFQPRTPEANFRGKPVVDGTRCIGCGACANACPPRLIIVNDGDGYRNIAFDLSRCTYCGSCRDVCPETAITMSPQFETATASPQDLQIDIKLKLTTCSQCGAVVGTTRALNKVKNILSDLNLDFDEELELCLVCKRKAVLREPAQMMEVAA